MTPVLKMTVNGCLVAGLSAGAILPSAAPGQTAGTDSRQAIASREFGTASNERAAEEKEIINRIGDCGDSSSVKALPQMRREQAVPLILETLSRAGISANASLPAVPSAPGGDKALEAVRRALAGEGEVRKTAVRALADWPDAAPMAELLKVAREDKEESIRILALRGFIRMATQPGTRTEQKLEAYRVALQRHEEGLPYALWLKTQLDHTEVAGQFPIGIAPPKAAPAQPSPLPRQITELQTKLSVQPLPQPSPAPPNPAPQAKAILYSRLEYQPPPLPPNPAPQPEGGIGKENLAQRPWPEGAKSYVERLKPLFSAQNVPPELVWIAEVESSFDPGARSRAGAAGLFQLMPATAKRFGLRCWPLDQRLAPEKSAGAAAKYLQHLHTHFNDWQLALAAYNAGEGAVDRLLQQLKAASFDAIAPYLPAETQMYVPRIAATLLRREGVTLSQL